MKNHYMKQLEEDIKRCKSVYYDRLEDLDENSTYYNDIKEDDIVSICEDMISYYGEDIEFPSYLYNNINEKSLYRILRILDKHRIYILDEMEKNIYQSEINKYVDEIKLYKIEIENFKKDLEEVRANNKEINIFNNQEQKSETAITTDVKVINRNNIYIRFEDARKKVREDNFIDNKEELLKKINELENIVFENVSSEEKTSKLKSIISWIGEKSYKGMELLIPLINTIIENS